MKLNKWTVALAALGAVSIGSVAQAADTASAVSTMSSTTLSGYVDTSAQWNLGTGDSHAPAYKYGGAKKSDGFNLDAVKISLEKPLDESEWAAGYKVDLFMGPDANTLGSVSTGGGADFAIKQAYVALRAPVGNGLDFKIGVFDSIIGYESTEAVNNPNFTRSWGHTFEPSTETGVLATYRVNNMLAFSAGVADTLGPVIDGRSADPSLGTGGNEQYKTYMGSVALTAPDSWGSLAGSTLYAGLDNGFLARLGAPQDNYYVGATINTPVTGLKLGASFDYNNSVPVKTTTAAASPVNPGVASHSFAAYASYQATEKMSFHARAEYADFSATAVDRAQTAAGVGSVGGGLASSVMSYTGTVQYDLWKNVLSRLEFRWDHALDGTRAFGGTALNAAGAPITITQSGHSFTGTRVDAFELLANVIYKF